MASALATTPGQIAVRGFDLNIGKVLEHWTVEHALRELLANALDERIATGTAEPEIFRDADDGWHIRDFGRGLRYEHLAQNESDEKHSSDLFLGQFGVGLKDALALFDRQGVGITIRSRHCNIALAKQAKAGFDDVVTLHATVAPPSDPGMVGTDIRITGVTEAQLEGAKSLFLAYRDDEVLETTPFGQVLAHPAEEPGGIFVRGLRIAEEENFLFSYNITATTATLRRALNRERSAVGRTAYSERVQKILLACQSTAVGEPLAKDLGADVSHDEVGWSDVAVQAARILQSTKKTVFVTFTDMLTSRAAIDNARGDGYKVMVVPDNLLGKLLTTTDLTGNPMVGLTRYIEVFNDSFKYKFVEPENLTEVERRVFDMWPALEKLARKADLGTGVFLDVKISERMRGDAVGVDADGVYEPDTQLIVIKRSVLRSQERFAGVFLHELCHARSGAGDVTRYFENALTTLIGGLATR